MAKNYLDHHCRHCHDLNGAVHDTAGFRVEP